MNDDLSEEDKALWRATIGAETTEKNDAGDDFETLLNEKVIKDTESANKQTKMQPHRVEKPPHKEPLDRSIERKLKQGKINPDTTIDLHGLNQHEAHSRLCKTVKQAYEKGNRHILVITGKGKSTAKAEDWLTPGKGVLKQKLPQWIQTQPLKSIVIDCVTANPKHGGSGAYYLILRKKK